MTTYSIAPQTSWSPPISKSDLLNKECPILGETFQTLINNRTSKSPLIIAVVQHVFEKRVKNGHNPDDLTEETTKKPEKKNHYFYFDAKSLWTWFITSQDIKNPVNRQTCKKIEFIWLTQDLEYFERCNAVLEIAEGETAENIFSLPESKNFSHFEDMHTLALSCYEEDPSLKTHKQLELLSKFSHIINPDLLRMVSEDIGDFFLSSLGNVQNLNELTKLSSWENEILTAFENIDTNTNFKAECIKRNLLFAHVIATLPKQNFSNLNLLSQITKAHPLVSAFYGMVYQREGNQKEADAWFRKSSTCPLHNSQQVAAIGSVLWINEAYFSCIDLYKINPKEFPHHLKVSLLKKLLPIPHLSSIVLPLATNILENEPKNLIGLYTLGTIYKYGNTYHKIPKNFSKAVEYFSLCLAQQPNEPGVLLHLGEMYYTGSSTLPKNRKLALEYFEKALQITEQKKVELLRLVGNLYYQGDTEIEIDYVKALRAYQEIITHHTPHDPQILTRIGNIFYYGKNGVVKDLDQAFDYYKTALTYTSKDWVILNQLGNIYIDGSKKVEANGNTAFEYFTRALKESPHNTDVLLSLAKLYWTGTKEIKSRYSKSIEYCQQILKINPKHVKALAFLANIYLYGDESVSRNIHKAFDYINRARQISPNDSFTLAILGTIYSDHFYAGKRNFKKAIELFAKSLKGNKEYDYPYLMLSKILATGDDEIQKDTIQAFSFFKIAVSLNPKNFKYGLPELQEAYSLHVSIQNLG